MCLTAYFAPDTVARMATTHAAHIARYTLTVYIDVPMDEETCSEHDYVVGQAQRRMERDVIAALKRDRAFGASPDAECMDVEILNGATR